MAYTKLLFYFIWATLVLQGISGEIFVSRRGLREHYVSKRGLLLQETSMKLTNENLRTQSKVGSVMPTCTFNECKGCKYKCSPKQVPVEGNDPINSAYRYRCICHR